MMKPPFKASDSAINVLSSHHGLICVVCGFIKHDFKVMKYIGYVVPTCAISGL